MKKKELYKDKILNIALNHKIVSVNKYTNEIEPCDIMNCVCDKADSCLFSKSGSNGCHNAFKAWCETEMFHENTNISKSQRCKIVFLSDLLFTERSFLKIVGKCNIGRDEQGRLYCYFNRLEDEAFYLDEKNEYFKFISLGEVWKYEYDDRIYELK